MTDNPILARALAWAAAGASVIPVTADGTKRPACPWKRWQSERADEAQIHAWFDRPGHGLGIICGQISGNLEMLEFEGRAVSEGLLAQASQAMDDNGHPGLWATVTAGCMETSPSGGIHLLYRVDGPVDGNTKIARRPSSDAELTETPGAKVQVLVETRGEGGYTVAAPSGGTVHKTGGSWVGAIGGPNTLPILTGDQRDALHAILSTLDALPEQQAAPRTETPTDGNLASPEPTPGLRPGDDFNARASWDDILAPNGWTKVRRDGPGWLWTRPGKNKADGISASTGTRGDGDNLYVWSTSTEFDSEVPMTKLFVYAHYWHHGDMHAAARQLSADGWGDQERTPALTLIGGRAPKDDGPASPAAADWWNERPVLAHIRDFALARMCSPAAVLGVVIERTLATIPPAIVLPPVIGGVGSLNLFCALVGPSGSGKGAAESAAGEAIGFSATIYTAPLGSGEGIAHCYAHYEPGKKGEAAHIEDDRDSVLFTVPEIDTLGAIATRKGSTLMEQLRSAYSGERLGFAYATAEKKLMLARHRYRLTLVAGVQPANAGPLLDDAGGGTPQRFIWMPATDRAITTEPLDCPAPIHVPQVHWEALPTDLMGRRLVTIPDEVARTIRATHAARARGEGDALDGHALFTREKVAVAFAALDGRAGMDSSDWELAGHVMDLSDATRAGIGELLAREQAERQQAAADWELRRRDNAEARILSEKIERVSKLVARKLGAMPDGQAWWGALRRRVTSKDRQIFEDAVYRLVDQHLVEVTAKDRNGQEDRMIQVVTK